jgi:catechol 2,3-dioxygenase-like lactoylglutathione lyase family enzyme
MATTQPGVLGSHVICQVGLIVRDIEKSAKAYADLFGMDVPAWSLTDSEEKAHTRYHGQPTEARAKLAFFDMGSLSLELIQPVGGPSTWQEFLDAHGEGVHHIAFQIKGMDGQLALLERKGMPLVQRGDYTGGRYAYIDAIPQLAVVLELLEND